MTACCTSRGAPDTAMLRRAAVRFEEGQRRPYMLRKMSTVPAISLIDLLQMEKASRNVKPFYSPHNVYNSRDQQARCLTATS
jgi:hypothetical protein